MDQMQAAFAELQAELRRQHDEILLLKSTSSKPKPSLPNPEKFSGQPYKFDTWLPSIKAKLRVDGEAIGDPVAQFYYVYLNLESHIQAMVLPQLSYAEESEVWDYKTILEQLARVYDNPNKVQEAEDKLLAIKQGTDSVLAYIAKFERVLHEAQGQNWPDVNKISTFRNGLNQTVRNRLAQQLTLPRQYPDFVRVVQQLASRSLQAPSPTNGPKYSSASHLHTEPMEINAINTIDPATPQRLLLRRDPATPERNQPSPLQRARSISPTLREQYRLQGRCVRCGSYNHWVQSCSLQPYSRGKGKLVVTAEDDDSAGSSVSLNWSKEVG